MSFNSWFWGGLSFRCRVALTLLISCSEARMKSRVATETSRGLRLTMWADSPGPSELHMAPAADGRKVTAGWEDPVTRVLDVSWQSLNAADTGDLLDALFAQSQPSSALASPLWSPCTTDSGINEEPLADPTDSFPSSLCAAFPSFDTPFFPPSLESQPPPSERNPYVSIDLGRFFPLGRGQIIPSCMISASDWALWQLRSFTKGKLFVSVSEGCFVVLLIITHRNSSVSLFFAFLCEITAKNPKLLDYQKCSSTFFFIHTGQQSAAAITNFFLKIYLWFCSSSRRQFGTLLQFSWFNVQAGSPATSSRRLASHTTSRRRRPRLHRFTRRSQWKICFCPTWGKQ